MTLPSLDIGVDRTVAFVVLVRVTPLGPVIAAAERNLEALVDLVTGSLDGSGACSFALPLPFSPGSDLSGTGSGAGARAVSSVVVVVERAGSDGSCFSGCGSGIVGATDGTGSGAGL